MADPDVQIRGGWGGGDHPDPEIRRGRAPQAPPLDPPLHSYSDIAIILNPSNVDIPTKRTLFVPSKANHIEVFLDILVSILKRFAKPGFCKRIHWRTAGY